ncbi:ankyrin repeat domain-containing protein [Candidatus Babeliales bacterium]|nr:ankyrin repeat domain-containing protein [Candidatus Babeliales bacterium]
MKKSFFCSFLIALAFTATVMPAASPTKETLLVALQNDDLVKIQEIIEVDKSNITICDHDGRTALYIAAFHDDIDLAEYILVHHNLSGIAFNKFINQPEKHCGWTPLHVATILEHDQMIDMLIKAGANTTKKDLQGRTPEQLAAEVVYSDNEYYDNETSDSSTDLSTDSDDSQGYLSSSDEDKSQKKRIKKTN